LAVERQPELDIGDVQHFWMHHLQHQRVEQGSLRWIVWRHRDGNGRDVYAGAA
jgi:hypothetical protein